MLFDHTQLSHDTIIILRQFGWFPERSVAVCDTLATLARWGWASTMPAVRMILESFSGLSCRSSNTDQLQSVNLQDGRVGYIWGLGWDFSPLHAPKIEPELVAAWYRHPFVQRQQLALCPLGYDLYDNIVFLASNGHILRGCCYAITPSDPCVLSLGLVDTSIYHALNRMMREALFYY